MAALGSIFLKAALSPLHFANISIMGRNVATGLGECAAATLRNHLQDGIRKTAVAAGVRPVDIQRILPMGELEAIAQTIDASQKNAVLVWQDQPVASRKARDLAALTMGGGMPQLHESLERLAQQAGVQTPLGQSLMVLAQSIQRWQDLILKSGTILDDDRALSGAFSRRTLRRVLFVLAGLAVVGAGIFNWQRSEQVRGRVNAKIGTGDPCAVLTIDPDDLSYANDDQKKQIGQRKATCDEERQRKEREQQERDKRAAYEGECDAAASQIESGNAPAAGAAILKKQTPLLGRMAKKSLDPNDLGPAPPELPCRDAPSAARFDAAFAAAVVGSSKAWLEGGPLSDPARAALDKSKKSIPEDVKETLDKNAEQLAARAIIDKVPIQVQRAKVLCGLKTLFELGRGPFCRGL